MKSKYHMTQKENINEEINVAFVKKVHMLLGKYTIINAGAFRRDEVRIGGTEWIPELPDEKKVDGQIHEILNGKGSPLDQALDMTLYLMRAQLFYDGNKRIAMLIGNKIIKQKSNSFYTITV